ncbi:VLRF1 family aeRF1-type release factor [Meiothermus sp.]|uniref:VLRF1 family aeRF1-type release factor n=1 Tax=Meiothermus sp. TaxID=1955249 RepID=UPI00307E9EF8
MLSKTQIQQLHQNIAQHPAPVLSLYLSVNPANPDNNGKAYVLRAKEALERLEVPAALRKKVSQQLQHYIPQGRTRALFVAENLFEDYHLQVELPLLDPRAGVEAHWGTPYLTPLLFALDEHQRYGVVHMDQERLRLFEVFLGEIEEIADAFRLLDTHNWRYLGEDRTGTPGRSASPAVGPVGVAARGGSGKDKFQRRVDEWSQRFFREAGTILQHQMLERGMERLILLGVPEEAKPLLPGPVAEKVGAILPALHTPVPSAAEVLKAVSEVIERVERSEEEALLEQVRQKGVGGLEQVLSLLQEGRLQYVLVPWHLQEKAWRCADGWVGSSPQAAQAHSPGQPVEEVELKQALPELAARYGTELEFVHGAVEERLRRELGGLAGMVRW